MRDFANVLQTATEDFEFSREMRYYTGRFHVTIGDRAWTGSFDDGALVEVQPTSSGPEGAAIWIKASADQWENLTAKEPVPFFQSLQSGAVRHGIQLSNTNEMFAYLPALNRLIHIFREMNVEGA